jgi:hypothetical protein
MGKASRKKKERKKAWKPSMFETVLTYVRHAKEDGLTEKEFWSNYNFPMNPIGSPTGTQYQDAFVLNAQNVSDYYWQHEKVAWSDKGFNVAPLFPSIWIEYADSDKRNFSEMIRTKQDANGAIPEKELTALKKAADENGFIKLSHFGMPSLRRGNLMTFYERGEGDRHIEEFLDGTDFYDVADETKNKFYHALKTEEWRWWVRSLLFIKLQGGDTVGAAPDITFLGWSNTLVRADGFSDRSWGVWSFRPHLLDEIESGTAPFTMARRYSDHIQKDIAGTKAWYAENMYNWHNVPFLTLTFSHCKNVTIAPDPLYVPRKQTFSVLQKQAHTPKPHIINITPMKEVIKRATGSVRLSPASMAIVRGHFKEYGSNGRGLLFGKHSGTFFIPSHVREGSVDGFERPTYRITGL